MGLALCIFLTPFVFVLKDGGPAGAVFMWLGYGLYKLLTYKADHNLSWFGPAPEEDQDVDIWTKRYRKEVPEFELDPWGHCIAAERITWEREKSRLTEEQLKRRLDAYKVMGCDTEEKLIEFRANVSYKAYMKSKLRSR